MRLSELLRLREIAIEHLAEEIKNDVAKRRESPLYDPLYDYSLYRTLDLSLNFQSVTAANKAASNLLNMVNFHPLVEKHEKPKDFLGLDYGDEPKELWDGLVVEAATELSNVAEIELPEWVKEKKGAKVKEVCALKLEIERLQAENEKLKADDPRQIRNMAKVIYGMAINKYQYKPELQRNTATNVIQGALEKQGIQLDRSTIKRYIDLGKQYLDEDGE